MLETLRKVFQRNGTSSSAPLRAGENQVTSTAAAPSAHVAAATPDDIEPQNPAVVELKPPTPTAANIAKAVSSPSATSRVRATISFGTPHRQRTGNVGSLRPLTTAFSTGTLEINSPSVISPTGAVGSFAFATSEMMAASSPANSVAVGATLASPTQTLRGRAQTTSSVMSPLSTAAALGASPTHNGDTDRYSPMADDGKELKLLSTIESYQTTLTIDRPVKPGMSLQLIEQRRVATLGKADLYAVTAKISPSATKKIFPDQPQKTPGCMDRVANFFRRCTRPSQKTTLHTVQLLGIALQGYIFYCVLNEENKLELALVSFANGYVGRLNLAAFSKSRPLADLSDRIIQTLIFPAVMVEQMIVSALYNGDWDSPAAEALVVISAGHVIGMRAARIWEDFLQSAQAAPLEEIDYSKGLPTMLPFTEKLRRISPELLFASGLMAAGLSLEKQFAQHSLERVSLNIAGQFGLALATAKLVKFIEYIPHFQRYFTVKNARISSGIAANFFPIIIRPGESFFYGMLVGFVLATNALAKERIWRHQNHMFAEQSKIMGEVATLLPDFKAKLDKALKELDAQFPYFRKLLLWTEGQPIEIIPPRWKKPAVLLSLAVEAGVASSFSDDEKNYTLLLVTLFYLITCHVRLDPKAYAELCEKELNNSLTTREKLCLLADRYLCKNPAIVSMAYVAAGKVWKITDNDTLSFTTFCAMTGIFYGTENRLAYNSPETLAMIEKALQQAYNNMRPDQLESLTPENRRYITDSLGIPDEKLHTAAEVSIPVEAPSILLTRQQALCLQQQLPDLKATVDVVGMFPSPRIDVTNSRLAVPNPIQAAAVSGSFGADLSNAVIG